MLYHIFSSSLQPLTKNHSFCLLRFLIEKSFLLEICTFISDCGGNLTVVIFSVSYPLLCFFSAGCGGNLTSAVGSVTSPGFPQAMAVNLTCEWLITVPPRRRITIKFSDINLGPAEGSTCSSTYVQIQVLSASGRHLVGKYCGTVCPYIFSIIVLLTIIKYNFYFCIISLSCE